MKYSDYKKQVHATDKTREYDLAFEIAKCIIETRVIKGLTQKELAKLVHTKQSSIARLENGKRLPSISFLLRIAEALGTNLSLPRFVNIQDASTIGIDLFEFDIDDLEPSVNTTDEKYKFTINPLSNSPYQLITV